MNICSPIILNYERIICQFYSDTSKKSCKRIFVTLTHFIWWIPGLKKTKTPNAQQIIDCEVLAVCREDKAIRLNGAWLESASMALRWLFTPIRSRPGDGCSVQRWSLPLWKTSQSHDEYEWMKPRPRPGSRIKNKYPLSFFLQWCCAHTHCIYIYRHTLHPLMLGDVGNNMRGDSPQSQCVSYDLSIWWAKVGEFTKRWASQCLPENYPESFIVKCYYCVILRWNTKVRKVYFFVQRSVQFFCVVQK